MPDRARLSEVAGPENIVHGRALAIVGDDEAWNGREKRRVPEPLRRECADPGRRRHGEILGRSGDPIEERLPHHLRLLPIEALEDHRKLDEARPKADLFAPMRIE